MPQLSETMTFFRDAVAFLKEMRYNHEKRRAEDYDHAL